MPEGGDALDSILGNPGGQEKAGESQEQFSERYRQNQAAATQAKKDEAKKHSQDEALAAIIVAFLNQHKGEGFFLLMARLVARNIPSDLLLAIISLIYPPAAEKIDETLRASVSSLQVSGTGSGGLFTSEVKAEIDSWTNTIARIARAEARRILQTAAEADSSPNRGVIQLFVLVLRQYLEEHHAPDLPFENLNAFGEAFFLRVFQDLQKISGDSFLLT